MRLFIEETLDRGVMCTPAWISVVRRVNPFYLDGFSVRVIIPWYKNDWYEDVARRERVWCRQYPEIFFFGKGFVGQRFYFGWKKAEDLGL